MATCIETLPGRAVLVAAMSAVLGIPLTTRANATSMPVIVQNCNDSGSGSLRAAYAAAVDATLSLQQLTCSSITLTSGPLTSHSAAGEVQIYGPSDRTFTISGNYHSRIFIHNGTDLAINHLTIENGIANDSLGGGCIYASNDVSIFLSTVTGCSVSTVGITPALGGAVRAIGTVVVDEASVTNSTARAAAADAEGGGIDSANLLVFDQSTISGNQVTSDSSHFARGGGAFAQYLTAGYSTISGNRAQIGAGLYLDDTHHSNPSTLRNMTISGNQASGAAGGMFCAQPLGIDNSTIADNLADFDAGLYLSSANAGLYSTIVANNASDGGLTPSDIGGSAGSVLSGSHNLILASALSVPAGTLSVDPKLGPLADNGGGVLTHALLRGSPAIDAGANPNNLYTDARGYLCTEINCFPYDRTFGASTDIGAFEFGSPDKIFISDFELNLD
jgi:hypothetical protein